MYKKLLVPVVPDHDKGSYQALEAAKTLCDKDGEIVLFHVFEAIPAFVAAQIPAETLEGGRKAVNDSLVELAKDAAGNVKIETAHGHASRTILDYAEENGVDCIVIASHRPGFEDYFLGSTAARVVRHASCAVHVVR